MNTKLQSLIRTALPGTLVLFCLILATGAQAATLYWDADGTGAVGNPPTSGVGGAGAWNTTSNRWWNGSSYQAWADNSVADFRVAAGTVTLTNNVTADGLTFANQAWVLTNSGGAVLTLNSLPNNITFASASQNIPIGTTLAGTLNFNGTSSTTGHWINKANTGVMSVSVGMNSGSIIRISDPASFGNAGVSVSVLSGARLYLDNSGPGGVSFNSWPTTLAGGIIRVRNGISPQGNSTYPGALTLTANSGLSVRNVLNNALTCTGTISLDANTLTLTPGDNSGGMDLQNQISGAGGSITLGANGLDSVALGSGVVKLSAANTFSGSATVSGGTLALNNVNALQNATLNTGAATTNNFVTFLVPGNNTYNLGALTGSDVLTNAGNTLSIGAKNEDSTFSADIVGAGGLTKVGSAKLTLNAATSYTGNSTISAGTLALGASLSASSTVSLAAGATLDVSALGSYSWGASASFIASGTGTTVGADAAELLGTTDLGTRPVTLNFTPASVTGDSTHPALYVSSGALTLNSPIAVVNNGASPLGAGTYVLIAQASGTITGTPTLSGSVGGQGLASGNSAVIQVNGGNVELVVQGAAPTATTLTRHSGTGSNTTYGDTLQFDVSVSPSAATGNVELRDGGPTGTVIGSGSLSGGSVSITPADNALAVGSHASLVALYLGDVNYQASASTALSTQTVTNKLLTVSGAVADSKYYDTTTAATLSGGTLNGVEIGDTVTLNQTGTFASAGPGTGITVTSTSTLGGASATNYILTQPTGLSADIYATAIWTGTAGDTLWNTVGNWLTNVAPNGPNVIADFTTLDPAADQTVNLDAARNAGHLFFGDTDTNTAAGWTLANNGSGANTLTLAGTSPSVTVNPLGSNKLVTISAVVAGNAGLTKAGAGTLTLSGANTFTGSTVISNGTLRFNADTGLGAVPGAPTPNTIVLEGGTLAQAAGNLTISANRGMTVGAGGGTLANPTSGNLTYSGIMGGTGTLTLDVSAGGGAGIVLGGQSTNSGNTTFTGNPASFVFMSASSIGTPGSLVSGPFGTGTVTFNGPGTRSTISGDTTVGNALSFAADVTFATIASEKTLTLTGPATITSNRTFTVNVGAMVAGKSVTFTNLISDGGNNYSLTKAGTGLLILAGPSTYGGGTVVSGGTLQVNNTSGSGTGAGAVTITNTGTLGGSGTISGAVTVSSGGKLAPGASVGTLTVSSLTLASGSGVSFEFTPVTGTPNDLVTVTTAGGLTLNGGAINLYESGGTVAFTNDGTYNLFAYSGTLNGSLNTLYIANPQPGKSYVLSADGSNVKLTIGTGPAPVYWGVDADGSWATALNWSPNTVPNAQFAAANFGGVGSPGFGGPHSVTLDGGKTVGALNFDTAQEFTINQGTGGSLQLDNGSAQAQVTGISGNHIINAPVTLPAVGANFTVATATTLAAHGAVNGSGGLTKSGPGTLVVSGANTYSGATTVSAGNLVVSNNAALGSTAGATVASGSPGGSVELANGVVVSGETITINGYGHNVRGALQAGAATTNEWAGPVILGAGTADSRVGAQADGVLKISGPISNGTINYLTVSADSTSGKVIVSGTANAYSGESQVLRGTLELGVNNALPTNTVLNVDSASSTTDDGAFEMNGFSQAVAGIRRGSTGGNFSIKNSSVTLSTLWVNNTNNYTISVAMEGYLALVKSGIGTLTLSGASTYTGNTTIRAGKLTLSSGGTVAGTPLITVSSNATLDVTGIGFTFGTSQTLAGSGTVLGDVTADGTIIPGSSVGTLTFSNNLTINGNVVVELNKSLAQSNDVINVLGTLNNAGTGTLTVSNVGPGLVVGDKFTLFSQSVSGGSTLNIAAPAGVTFTNQLDFDGSITVLTAPATTANYPTNITSSVSGSMITLTWPATHLGWFLQAQTNTLGVGLTTPTNTWHDIAGSDADTSKNITVSPVNPSVFFRLRHP